MTLAYIRPDKNFDAAGEQLQLINSYAHSKNIVIDDEFIDHISQNKRLEQRTNVTNYFKSNEGATLLVYDVWVLSTNMEDIIQMFSCMLKKKFSIHFIKQSVIISEQSNAVLVLGLIDQLRVRMQNDSKRVTGRPKGSKSNSKFDKHVNEIISCIKEKKCVSEIARQIGQSRSSLKDYIESRELKLVAHGSLVHPLLENAEEQLINKISCPD